MSFDLAPLPAIEAPTLIVGGGCDRYYGPELFEETAATDPQLPGRGQTAARPRLGAVVSALARGDPQFPQRTARVRSRAQATACAK